MLVLALFPTVAIAASFTIVLDKSVYEYGDIVGIRVNGTLPCDIATLRVVSPIGEPVKVMLITADDAAKGISIPIPSIPTGGWVAGSYRVEIVCGAASASVAFTLKSKPLPPPPKLPTVYVTVVEKGTGLPVPKAVLIAYDSKGNVLDVEETGKDGKATLTVVEGTVKILVRAAGYYMAEANVNVDSSVSTNIELERITKDTELEERVGQLEAKVDLLSRTISDISAKVDILAAKLSTLQDELKNMVSKLADVENLLKDLECRVKALEEAVKDIIRKLWG